MNDVYTSQTTKVNKASTKFNIDVYTSDHEIHISKLLNTLNNKNNHTDVYTSDEQDNKNNVLNLNKQDQAALEFNSVYTLNDLNADVYTSGNETNNNLDLNSSVYTFDQVERKKILATG